MLRVIHMLLFASVASLASIAHAAEETCEKKIDDSPNCPNRDHIIRCTAAYMDKNNNNMLERSELVEGIDSLPLIARGVLSVIGGVDSIMDKCDADKDGAISMNGDMQATAETCLKSCIKKRAFKAAFFPDCEL